MPSALMRRVRKLDAATRFTVATPADILGHPVRMAMLRAYIKRVAKLGGPGAGWLAGVALGFSDALLVDFIIFNLENDALRAAGRGEDEIWERAVPWWRAALGREPAAVAPVFARWVEEGALIETGDGYAMPES